MSYLHAYLKTHKRIAIVIVLFLVVVIVLSVSRCSQIHAPAIDQPQSQHDDAATTAPETAEKRSEKDSNGMDSEQTKLVSAYTSTTTDFLKSLNAYVWIAQDETCTVTFNGSTYQVNRDAHTQDAVPFAVSAVKGPPLIDPEPNSDNKQTSSATDSISPTFASFLLKDGHTSLVTFSRGTPQNKTQLTMTTDMFTGADTQYLAVSTQSNISIENIDQAISDFKLDKEQLKSDLDKEVKQISPMSSTATLQGDIVVNYEKKTIDIPFTLDGMRNGHLTATYHTDSKSYSFSKSSY